MSARFICNTCQHVFTVSESVGSQACPMCGSIDISEKSGGGISFNKSTLKKIIIPVAIVAAAIIVYLLWPPPIEKIIIEDVKCDKSNPSNMRLIVTARASEKRRIQYSFDYGKTYQNSRIYKVKEPKTYRIVVRDDKKNKAEWPVPFTFTKNDFPCATCPPPCKTQITSVDKTDVIKKNDGQIIIHVTGCEPYQYSIDGGQSYTDDSIFNNLAPGKYKVQVTDNASIIVDYFEDVEIDPVGPPLPPPPSKTVVESKLNRLYSNPDNKALLDSINRFFVNESMEVDCELIGIPPGTRYQLFQFLQRRYDGKPGSKKVQVLRVGYSGNKINFLQVREIPVSTKK